MTDSLALEVLFNGVVARFAADSTLVPNLFGWREKSKHVTNGTTVGNRVIWVPGDEEGAGDSGKLAAPSKMSLSAADDVARSLGTLLEFFTTQRRRPTSSRSTRSRAYSSTLGTAPSICKRSVPLRFPR